MSRVYLITPEMGESLLFSGKEDDFWKAKLLEEIYDEEPPYFRYWETERGTMCDFGSHTDFLLITDD